MDAQGEVVTGGLEGKWRGTKTSTVILVKDDGEVTFVEREIAKIVDGVPILPDEERRFAFQALP
jgi:uncharacterized protein with NRDE domain